MNEPAAGLFARVIEVERWFDAAEAAPPPAAFEPVEDIMDLAAVIGANVRRRRKWQGLSLETLARRSRVSRAMLSQIELGRSTPTVAVLWKIASALNAPLMGFLREPVTNRVRLLPAASGRRAVSRDGAVCARALFPAEPARRVEFYEWRLKASAEETVRPHPAGTWENLVVGSGAVEIVIDGVGHLLKAGDAIEFAADVAHGYRNLSPDETVLYLVMTYNIEGE
ncbi:MAG TPA: helix-turn-helix domain-containing protein [Candidatus Competibacter sp.]|nr:helix-turn-helix domain-containing protein [Candidatus Competibacter sp.]